MTDDSDDEDLAHCDDDDDTLPLSCLTHDDDQLAHCSLQVLLTDDSDDEDDAHSDDDDELHPVPLSCLTYGDGDDDDIDEEV